MKTSDGKHTTPKTLAEDILMDAISAKMEFFGESGEVRHLTAKQKGKVFEQAHKVANRLAKRLGYDSYSGLGEGETPS